MSNTTDEALKSISPFLQGVIQNANGMIGVLNGLKNDPRLSADQKKEIDEKLKAADLENIEERFHDAVKDLRKASEQRNANYKV